MLKHPVCSDDDDDRRQLVEDEHDQDHGEHEGDVGARGDDAARVGSAQIGQSYQRRFGAQG